MITANKPEDKIVIYTIHESDLGQKVRWLPEEMAVPYGVRSLKTVCFFGSVVMQRTKRAVIRRVYGKCS